jgi:hypothetical protein
MRVRVIRLCAGVAEIIRASADSGLFLVMTVFCWVEMAGKIRVCLDKVQTPPPKKTDRATYRLALEGRLSG